MFTRFAAAVCSILLLTACEEEASKNICKGRSETDCTAKSECNWNAEKAKCRMKKERPPETSEPSAGSEQAPPEQKTPPAASEQAPPEQSAPPTPSGPSTTPETGPGDTPPQ